jgi:epoxyqueuosine reductase
MFHAYVKSDSDRILVMQKGDICQEVCPINSTHLASRHPTLFPTAEPAFQPRPFLKDIKDVKDLLYLTQEQFSAAFKGSAVKRAKWNGLRRNSTAALSVPSSRR